MKKLIIIGAGGHGKVVADIAQKSGYNEIEFLDSVQTGDCMGFPIVDKCDNVEKYIDKADFFVAIGNTVAREKYISLLLSMGANLITLIHPSSVIDKSVTIGRGTVVMAGVVVNSSTKIGQGVIINTSSSIDHDCEVADYCHVSVGVHVAGTVNIGKRTWLGIGAIISNNLSICDDCMIGAGSLVLKNVTESGTYYGSPVRKIR